MVDEGVTGGRLSAKSGYPGGNAELPSRVGRWPTRASPGNDRPDLPLLTDKSCYSAPRRQHRLRGQRPPLKPREVWATRVRLQIQGALRDLALFNLAIDSKLRSCDLVALRVADVATAGSIRERPMIFQQKTGHPVQFELTDQTRESVLRWITQQALGKKGKISFWKGIRVRCPECARNLPFPGLGPMAEKQNLPFRCRKLKKY